MSASQTKKEVIAKLKKAQKCSDAESAHDEADKALCELLEALGCATVVKEWKKVPKWYA